MKVLVTGASGFIGSHTARYLVRGGHIVVATGRNRERLLPLEREGVQIAATDLASDALEPLLQDTEVVVHCAARASPWGPREVFWRDNVVATERLLDVARRAGAVRRFVFLSSPSIYFKLHDQLRLTEAFEPPQRWPTVYAETKWEAECRVRAASELGPIVLRPRAVFGPGDRAIVPRLLAVARHGVFPVPAGGKAWVDVTYIDNAVQAIARAIEAARDAEGHSFNITNGEPVQVRDLLTRIFTALKMPVRLISIPRLAAMRLAQASEVLARMRSGAPEPRLTVYGMGLLAYSQTLSLEAARQVLGYAPILSIDAGIERYAQWWSRQ